MKNISIIFSFCFLFHSCDSKRFYEEYKTLPNDKWSFNNQLTFEVPINDTLSNYNFYAGIRNNENYKFMNLYVFMDVISPSGKIEKDTIEFIIANLQGKWLGNKAGDMLDNLIWFKTNYQFHETGNYSFIFKQAMREESLSQLSDFGLRIEKME